MCVYICIDKSKLKSSFIMSHSTIPKSLVQFDYGKAASMYLGAQGTCKVTLLLATQFLKGALCA